MCIFMYRFLIYISIIGLNQTLLQLDLMFNIVERYFQLHLNIYCIKIIMLQN